MEPVPRRPGPENTPSPAVFEPDPAQGRVFTAARVVRSTDVTPAGRLRLDALARYLQEAAEDDLAAAGWDEPYGWLLRRCEVAVRDYPGLGQRVALRTFCSATGPRWAERITTVSGPSGDLVQARAVWVAITRADGRPCPLGAAFHRLYGPSTGGRRVSARLSHPGPPPSLPGRLWPLRASDFDPAGHVNNTVYWAAVEDVLAGPAAPGEPPVAAELEYHRPMLPGHEPSLVSSPAPGELSVWLLDGPHRLASARLALRR
ncbi:MAG TPA: acyl-ACP thioesterase domain-containing protein [Streptosporangiaceae bacterium]|nr:acyl-ACP thioesterase domain-containing protein [Streptosporangiaceae bacterium]